jgi:putative ABC transport system permease protein
MIKNYIKVSLRNIKRNKLYSAINIIGFAAGITCALFILYYVAYELSYDRYHAKADRIYRIALSFKLGGTESDRAIVGAPTAAALVNDFPEIEDAVRLKSAGSQYIRYGENMYKEPMFIFADATFFKIFTLPLLKGDPRTALKDPSSLVISEKAAKKYFGTTDPMERTLTINSETDFIVKGIFKDIPGHSHFHSDFIGSMASIEEYLVPEWTGLDVHTYLLLQEGADFRVVEAKFPVMVSKYCGPEFQQFTGKGLEELKKSGTKWEYFLQPLTSIHLNSHLGMEMESNSDIKYVYIFSTLAVFILLIAGFNFINLSTAQATKRTKEVGIRKVVGSARIQLILQFLLESMVMSVAALMAAFCFVQLLAPSFFSLIGRDVGIGFFSNLNQLLLVLLIILFLGVITGSYPAFVLSSFKPVAALKQKIGERAGKSRVRRFLVVFQFMMSVALIIGTTVVYKQLKYIQNRDLGFQKEQVMIVQDAYILREKLAAFKQELMQSPGIVHTTVTSFLPVTSSRRERTIFLEGRADQKNLTTIQVWDVSYDYVKTFNMKIVKGRDFSREFATDSDAVIINEAAVKKFEWTDPIGKTIGMDISSNPPVVKNYTVVGVIKDFNFDSLRDQTRPLGLFLQQSSEFLVVRFNTKNILGVTAFIKDTWNKYSAGYAFEYSFLDDRFNNMYRSELRSGRIMSVFSALAVVISCLGLFGLAAFMAEQRTKEIGIRKILGATVPEVLFLLWKEFGKLVLVSFAIAAPISYFFMAKWLQDFAYRTSMGISPFVLSGVLTLAIAMLTVGYYSVKLALTNPADSLGYE